MIKLLLPFFNFPESAPEGKENGNDHSKSANLAADGLEVLVRNEATLPQSPEYLPLRKQVLGYVAGCLKDSRTRKIIEERAVLIYDPAAA